MRNTRFAFMAAIVGISIAACSTTPQDLQSKSAPLVVSFPENYQEIYRRIVGEARRCLGRNIERETTYEVDTDLYSDLGYGEVSWSLNSLARNYYMTAKVERDGTGSRLTVHAGNQAISDSVRQQVVDWARGGTGCPVVGL